jgi:hypothetical protein
MSDSGRWRCNFLETKPDQISVSKTDSAWWLARFICQIVVTLGWKREFRCEGVENLTDFEAVVDELNSVDPDSYAFRSPVSAEPRGFASGAREFARKMDALLDHLASTAAALAAEWDLPSAAMEPSSE